MPLREGNKPEDIAYNIRLLEEEGRKKKEAIAIALEQAKKASAK